jgi:uncharacterized membrane protein YphA (DoxX/SURF4 family)
MRTQVLSRQPVAVALPSRARYSAAGVRPSRAASLALWTAQVLTALLFLMAGGMKLVLPVEAMAGPLGFPGWFLRFIGTAEVLGAIGLIVPAATRIQPWLTPLAAEGLLIIMAGAVTTTLMIGGGAQAIVPAVTALVLTTIAYGRTRAARVSARVPARATAR